MRLSELRQRDEELRKQKEAESEAGISDIGISETPTEETYREPEPVESTGETETTDGEIEPQLDTGGEVLAEGEGNTDGRVRTRAEWALTIQSDGDGGTLYVPQSEEDIEGAYKVADLNWRHIRTEGLGTSQLYSGVRGAIHHIGSLFSQETSDFDIEEAFKRDGIPLEDRELYDGVTTARDYEYTKKNIEQERTDKQLLSEAPIGATLLANTVEFGAMVPLFSGVDKAFGALWKAGNLADKAVRLSRWKQFFSFIKPSYMEDLFKASGAATLFGTAEYAAKYDVTGEEAFYQGLTWALFDGGLRLTGRAVSNKIAKKMADEISEDVCAKDLRQLILSRMEQMWNGEVTDNQVSKIVETLGTKGITATHPLMTKFVKNKKVSDMANKLFTFNDEIFENARWVDANGNVLREAPAELSINFNNTRDLNDFLKITDDMKKINKDVKKYEGITSREYLQQAIYTGGENLPADLPHRERIINAAKNIRRKIEDMEAKAIEIRGYSPEMEPTFLPYEFTGKNFSIEKLVELQQKGILGSKPGYLPRWYSREAILENEEEFKELLKQGLLNEKRLEIGDSLSAGELKAELEKYADSTKLKNAVNKQFENVLSLEKSGTGAGLNGDVLRRTIRVDDRALYKFFRGDSIEVAFNYLRRQRGILEFERVYKEAGYKTWEAFMKDVEKDYSKVVTSLTGEAAEAVRQESAKVQDLLKQVKYIMLYRYVPYKDALEMFGANSAIFKAIEGARNVMMAAWLGRVVFSSLSDVKGMIARYGLGNAVTALMQTVGGAFDKAIRNIAHLPKSEFEEIVDSLTTGIEENRMHASLKCTPFHNEDAFFGPTKTAKPQLTRKIADAVFIASGQRAFDNGLRRMGLKLVLKDMLKNSARKAEISKMIKSKQFSEDVQKEIYQKLNRLVSKPGLADIPAWNYSRIGKFFYILQSWTFSNTMNYVYPLLNGSFTKRYAVESLLTTLSLKTLETYAKEWLRGSKYDLSKQEEQDRFWNAMIGYGLADFTGAMSLYWDSYRTIFDRRGRFKNPVEAAASLSPLFTYGSDLSYLGNVFIDLFHGKKPSYYAARKALHAIPGNTLPGVERFITVPLAETVSGQSRDSKGRGKRRRIRL